MGLFSLLRKEDKLESLEKRIAVISGALLVVANGFVGVAEGWIASGVVAVVIGAMPIWILLMGWLFFGESRPGWRKMAGAVVGVFGIALIATGDLQPVGPGSFGFGIFCLLLSGVLWSCGTLVQRRLKGLRAVFRFSTWQMFSGAIAAGFLSLLFERPWAVDWSAVSSTSWFAMWYLVVFGSVISFTAYAYLSRNFQPHVVSTYALVNPLIAVGLGWLFLSEPVNLNFGVATLLVLVGLGLLLFQPRPTQEQD